MGKKVCAAAFLAFAATIAAGAVLWPAIALLARVAAEWLDGSPRPDVVSTRQAILLLKSMGLAGAAATLCVVLSIPAASVLAAADGWRRNLVLFALAATMLCPPMVYAFGWQRLLPAGIGGHFICVMIWAGWAWPLAALPVASGLRANRAAFESALLDAGRLPAVWHVLLPGLLPHALIAAVAVFVLFLADYSVPHACGLIVFATETLGWASNSTRAIDTLAPALPGAAVVLAGVGALIWALPRIRGVAGDRPAHFITGLGTSVLLAVAWAIPLGGLMIKLESSDALGVAMRTYAHDIIWTLLAAAAGALAVCVLAIAAARWRRIALAWTGVTLVFGILPGALIGQALVTAYNRPATGWLYDSWLIVSAGHVARFAWLGALVGLLLCRDLRSPIADQAGLDGAGRWSTLLRLLLPARGGLMAGLALAVLALSLGEAATAALVRVPSFSPVSLVIIEKFHRLEDDMLISLSLLLVSASLPAAAAVAWAWRRDGA